MDTAKKKALSEFSRRAMQRLWDKKVPKSQTLNIPSLDTDIKIRNLTYEEIVECTDSIFCATEDMKVVCIPDNKHLFQSSLFHCMIARALILAAILIDEDSIFSYQRMLLPLALNPMVKFIQDDICQQRRNDTALWRTLCSSVP